MVRPLLRFVMLSVLLAPLAACGHRLDVAKVEADIQSDIERQGRRLALRAVRCPTDISRQAGAFFRCVGELEPEGTFTINVTQEDDQGSVSWDVPNSKALLNLVRVEEGIQRQLTADFGQRAFVDCGEAVYRLNQPGDRFECRVVGGLADGAGTIQSVLVKVNAAGNLDWQEQRGGTVSPPGNEAAPALGTTAAHSPIPPTQPDSPSRPPTQANPATPAVQTTPTTGPTGRPINRPYVPGDND